MVTDLSDALTKKVPGELVLVWCYVELMDHLIGIESGDKSLVFPFADDHLQLSPIAYLLAGVA